MNTTHTTERTAENKKLSIKNYLSQDVETKGVEMMTSARVIPFGVSIWG